MRDWTMSLLAGMALATFIGISACASHDEPSKEPIPDWYQGAIQPESPQEGFLLKTAHRAEMPKPKVYKTPPAASSPVPPAATRRHPEPHHPPMRQEHDYGGELAAELLRVFTWTVMDGPRCHPIRWSR